MNLIEVDKISEGIAILILSIIGFSLKKFSQFENWMSSIPDNVSQGIFLYISGLIICEKKATNAKMAKKLGYVSHDTLTRTLIKAKRAVELLPRLLINFCLSQTMGYLIIDDVLIPKRYSKKIQGVYNEYDHVDKERLKGMKVVMILWSNGKIRIPITWAIWHKERKYLIGRSAKGIAKYRHTGECLLQIDGQVLPYKTKNQIALELLEDVLSRGLKVKYITFDSWYASRENLQKIVENNFALPLGCYSRLKNNRKIVYQEQKMNLAQLDQLFPITTFNHKHNAYIKTVDVLLPGYGDIRLLLVRNDSHDEPGKTKYIFSTDYSASASEILLRYRSRWIIETTFRDMKQNLNLETCQCIDLDAQKTHLALSIFAFILLELLPTLDFQDCSYNSVGEKKLLFSKLSFFTNSTKSQYWIIDSSKYRACFFSLEKLKIGIVKLCVDFAYKTLLYPSFKRTA